MNEDRDGFEVRGLFYPWAKEIRPIDQPLVVEVTGVKFNDFLRTWYENIEKVTEAEERGEQVDPLDLDPTVMNGLIAAAIWQQHKDWSRQKMIQFFTALEQEDIELLVGDTDEEDRQTDPLPVDDKGSSGSGSSSTTSDGSSGSPESLSEKTPPSTGTQPSATISRDLRQVI